jgi:hypothetical protein
MKAFGAKIINHGNINANVKGDGLKSDKEPLLHEDDGNDIVTFKPVGIAILLTSCQKVIVVDLNASAPQVVIEGNVYDQPGPYN